MNNFLILGSNGLLGSSVSPILSSSNESLVLHTRLGDNQFSADLQNLTEVNRLLKKTHPKKILNLAALANVDFCQDSSQAYLGNVKPIENIVNSIKQLNLKCYFINISTDHLYNAPADSKEENIDIVNNYAFSKYFGEIVAQKINSCSIRTNFFGKSLNKDKNSFTDWLFQKLANGDKIKVFKDVYFNPLYMPSMGRYIDLLSKIQPNGVFNIGSRMGLSKSNFAYIFAEELRLPRSKIESIRMSQADFIKSIRPKDMRMDVSKIESLLELKMPILADEIKLSALEYINEI